jgi:hypothetical protein
MQTSFKKGLNPDPLSAKAWILISSKILQVRATYCVLFSVGELGKIKANQGAEGRLSWIKD